MNVRVVWRHDSWGWLGYAFGGVFVQMHKLPRSKGWELTTTGLLARHFEGTYLECRAKAQDWANDIANA